MNYTLRQATEKDSLFFYELKKLVLKGYVEKIWGWDEVVQQAYHRDNYRPIDTLIIEVEENDAGTVEIREDENLIFICSLYIYPKYQGASIGSSIVKMYLGKAIDKNKTVALEVLRLNTRAKALYERLGFKVIESKSDDVKIYMMSGQQ